MIGEGIVKAVSATLNKAADKIWMDKGEKEKLEFSKEELKEHTRLAIEQMHQNGELTELEYEFKEAESQRTYQLKHFGSAEVLKTFAIGKVILLGRASIRWIIVGYAAFEAHGIIKTVLTPKVIEALANGNLKGTMAWLVLMLIIVIAGIPLAYVTGTSIEKLMKARGVI